jgi:hypothetical protein
MTRTGRSATAPLDALATEVARGQMRVLAERGDGATINPGSW